MTVELHGEAGSQAADQDQRYENGHQDETHSVGLLHSIVLNKRSDRLSVIISVLILLRRALNDDDD